MGTQRRFLVGLVVAIVAWAPASTVFAFVRTMTCMPSGTFACAPDEVPLPVMWNVGCVNFHITTGGSADIPNTEATNQAIIDGYEAWNEPTCSYLQLNYAGMTDEDRVGYNVNTNTNANIIVFRDTGWTHSNKVLALTSVTFQPSTGQIFDADIELNSAGYDFTATDESEQIKIDLRNTVTHEVGHFLGLDHSADPESTMYATAPLGETKKRTLEVDDEAGLCTIYPTDLKPAGNVCGGASVGFFERPLVGPGESVPNSSGGSGCSGCLTAATGSSSTPLSPWWALVMVGCLGLAVLRSARR